MDEEQSCLERIYEAAVVPELWPEVIDGFAKRTEAAFGSLFVVQGDRPRWIGTPEAEKLISDFYVHAHPNLINPRIAGGMAFDSPGFFTDYDLFTKKQIADDPFYREFMYPRGYGWTAGTKLAVPGEDIAFFTLERRTERGNFEPAFVELLNSFRPHIGRAALLAARLDLQRARTMTQALETVGLPAAVLRAGGALYAANARFERLIPTIVRERKNRLAFVDPNTDLLLACALGQRDLMQGRQVQSIPVAATDADAAMIFHVLPVCRAAHDIFAQAGTIVVVTMVDHHPVPGASVLQGLFDLTPAEARVARGIAEGQTTAAMAVAYGVSRATVRSQVRAVLSKTGLRRQAELVNLLGGSQLPG